MIKVDSSINDEIKSDLKQASESLSNDINDKILNDYSYLIDLSLFSKQLEDINKCSTCLTNYLNSFSSIIENNKAGWEETEEEVGNEIGRFESGKNTGSNGGGSSGNNKNTNNTGGETNSSTHEETKEETVTKGKEVSIASVTDFIDKIDYENMPILLQKISNYLGSTSITDLLLDENNSGLLVSILKQILGDTTGDVPEVSDETKAIQNKLLSIINTNNVDITTEEGQTELKNTILSLLTKDVDESKWNSLMYGDSTISYEAMGETWIIAKTNSDLNSYASYIKSQGVRQNANDDWSGACLAFAGAHAYDLYAGTNTSGEAASNYAHGGQFEDFMSDDKQTVLEKIYDEIMNGRPVVLQVNGNKAGTSRHFVTVVGFKSSVTNASNLSESDLLIVDSWDGNVESMDNENSRFMTSGADCGKSYSGYRIRVLKS